MTRRLSPWWMLALLCGCAPTDQGDGASDPGAADEVPPGVPASKADADEAASLGKADWSIDPCDWWGWYEDGACDWYCWDPDPDCAPPPASFDEETGLWTRYTLPGDDGFPESVAFDPARRAFFVGSAAHGEVLRIKAEGEVEVFYPGTGEADRATLGVEVDAAHDRLLVCTILNVDVPVGRVWIFDLASGAMTHDVDLTEAAPEAGCNDLTADEAGRIYVTDREDQHIYQISDLGPGGEYKVSLWADDALLAPPRIGLGQNGAAITPEGDALITTQYLPPRLWRVTLDDPEQVEKVEVTGRHPFGELLSGADGITFHKGDLYVAFGTSVMRVRSTDGWRSAAYTRLQVGEKITGIVSVDDTLYVLKCDIAKLVLGGDPSLPFELIRVDPADFD